MANKNKGKVVQMLSPENYIRQRARSLPMFECAVNTEWKESKIALLTIARRHTNGNITSCMYMVDLFCQGVKDTHYHFNIPLEEYRENQARQSEMMDFEPIDYNLAHNIVYSALAFAEDLEFKPHKDFTSITRFMLEEDTEDIPLIEIQCGLNGKPAFLLGMQDDEKADQRIIAHLERVVGPDNFTIISDTDEIDDFEPEDQDDLKEKERKFLELYDKEALSDSDEYIHFLDLANDLFNKLTDDSEFDKYYDEFKFLKDFNLKDAHVSNEMLGVPIESTYDYDDLRTLFSEIFYMTIQVDKDAPKKLKTYRKKARNLPSTYFLELIILQFEPAGKGFNKKLVEYYIRFPEYKLLRMLFLSHIVSLDYVNDTVRFEIEQIILYYRQKKNIHEIEFFPYLLLMISKNFETMDPSRINALHAIIDELGIYEFMRVFLQTLILNNKANLVKEILDEEKGINESNEEPF